MCNKRYSPFIPIIVLALNFFIPMITVTCICIHHIRIYTQMKYTQHTHTYKQHDIPLSLIHIHMHLHVYIHGVCDILFSDSCLDWLAKLGALHILDSEAFIKNTYMFI